LSTKPPILIIGFNRPEMLSNLFQALKTSKPKNILFAVDGPRINQPADLIKVKQVQESIKRVDWHANIETRFRSENLGLKNSVVDAVSWAIEEYGEVIVLEDDAIPGPEFYEYMTFTLSKFRMNTQIGHVSGYNQVPKPFISNPQNLYRLSIYPESYAWGTWSRSWKFYKDELTINSELYLEKLFSRLVWNQYFDLAREELISTWAFRWINALWDNKFVCISPNVNLVSYIGQSEGTHTKRKPRANELPISAYDELRITSNLEIDVKADKWIGKKIFHENIIGFIENYLAKLYYKSKL